MTPTSNPNWFHATKPEDILLPPEDPTGAGARMLKLVGNFTMTQGDAAGSRFTEHILPWQERIVLRGWGDMDADGKPIIREIGYKGGKGSGKSVFVSALAVAMVMDWSRRRINTRGHIIVVAAGVESALIVYNHIREGIAADTFLVNRFKSNASRKELVHIESGITIRVIAPDIANCVGLRTCAILADELHAAAISSRDFVQVVDQLKRGGSNMPEFKFIGLTTAAVARPEGFYRDWITRMRAVRDGHLEAPDVLPCLWEYPVKERPDLDVADPATWYFGMPSLRTPEQPRGTMDAKMLEDELREAADSADLLGPAAMEQLLSQRLGIEASDRCGGSGATPLARHWQACLVADLAVPDGAAVYVGLDPSAGLDDPAACVAVILSGGDYYVRSRQFLTREAFNAAPRKLKEIYDAAVAEDELVVVDNTVTLEQSIFAYCKQLRNATFGGDARGLAGFVRRFEEQLGAYKAVPQNWELRAALEYANGLAADRRIHHAGQPLLSYNVSNLVYENGKMVKFDATSSGIGSGKIDGCMAMLSAIQIAESEPTWDIAGMIG